MSDLSELSCLNILFNIQKQFFSCCTLNHFIWQGILKDLCDEKHGLNNQKILLDWTVTHKINIDYPVKSSYQQKFLKHIVSYIEKEKCEVSDTVYKILCEKLNLKNLNTHFKHYKATNEIWVTLEENINIISHGSTGLCSWQAAFALADYCIVNKSILDGKTVLELGSGVGLTGIALVYATNLSKYCFTDCHLQVLGLLCSNVILNKNKFDNQQYKHRIETGKELLLNCKLSEKKVCVYKKEWKDFTSDFVDEINPDVVLAADVVFDDSVFDDLKHSIVCCLNSREKSVVLLACTVRNIKTLTTFINILISSGLIVKELNYEPSGLFCYSQADIKLLQVENLNI